MAEARAVFERNQIILSKGLIRREAFDTAKARFDQSQSKLRAPCYGPHGGQAELLQPVLEVRARV